MNKTVRLPREPAPGPAPPGLQSLGSRIRAARETKGVSLREFARVLGLSPSLISQIERGRVMPSVGTLYSISNELDLTFDDVFSSNEQPGANSPEFTPAPQSGGPVQRAHDRKRIRLAGGVRWERLTPAHDEQLECRDVSNWLKAGNIRYREHVVSGLENAPEALIGLLEGRNFGKLLVQV